MKRLRIELLLSALLVQQVAGQAPFMLVSFIILIEIMILTTSMMLCGVRVLTILLILECGIILMDGTEVPLFDGDFIDSSAPSPVFSKRFSGQIACTC